MPDPVDPDALAEALAAYDEFFTSGDTLTFEPALAAAARAVLEAPTAEWCEVHKRPGFTEFACTGWSETDGTEDIGPCKFGRVRLVAEK